MAELALDVAIEKPGFSLQASGNIALDRITALFGASGSGKTTLLRIIAGLEPAARGKVVFDGQVWQDERDGAPARGWKAPATSGTTSSGQRGPSDERETSSSGSFRKSRKRRFLPPHERAVGFVFQDTRLFTHLSVEGNLRFALRHGRSGAGNVGSGSRDVRSGTRDAGSGALNVRSGNRIRMSEVVAALDLERLLARRPASLSGGERQRVAIGRALLANPQVLLMDEPLSSLDTPRKREIVSYIEALPERFAIPVLYVTHDIDEVARLSNRMLLLSAGRIAAQGSVSEILGRIDLWPSMERLEAGSVIEARVERHEAGMTHLAFETGTLQVPAVDAVPGKVLRLRVHARDVAVATERPQHLSIRNILPATIEKIDLDATVHAELLLGVGAQTLRARITRNALEDLGLAEGQQVHALIKSVLFEGRL